MYMKVMLVNGSSREHGCTARAMEEVAKALQAGCVGTETSNFQKAGSDRKKALPILIDSLKQMADAAEKLTGMIQNITFPCSDSDPSKMANQGAGVVFKKR